MNPVPHAPEQSMPHRARRTARAALWLPGLLVALGAAVATAHGLYEVARAAKAPALIAALYPLITDGLALVAYAATARLSGSGRRYAWTVVVLAAGLSGLAQASYLAHGVASASAALRFGVGAWPAIAAAIVAHLLYLIGTDGRRTNTTPDLEPDAASSHVAEDEPETQDPAPAGAVAVSELEEHPTVQLPAVQSNTAQSPSVQPDTVRPDVQSDTVQPAAPDPHASNETSSAIQPLASRPGRSPARDRAESAAKVHHAEHGDLPTVARLMELADVSRGTAGEALKTLRSQPADLHIVHEPAHQEAH